MAKFYKLSFVLACFTLLVTNVLAQNARSASTRYKRDFEIKGVVNPDNALLQKIDLSRFDYLRQADKRVEAKDAVNNIIIILYSENEIRKMKQEHTRNYTGEMKTVTDVKNVPTPKSDRQ